MASVNIDPMFIFTLSPDDELYGFISPLDPRNGGHENGDNGEKEGTKRTAIALDSGSTVHLFKDDFLLENIHQGNARKIEVATTNFGFVLDQVGHL